MPITNIIHEYLDSGDRSPYGGWLASLSDPRAKAKVIMQVDRMEPRAIW